MFLPVAFCFEDYALGYMINQELKKKGKEALRAYLPAVSKLIKLLTYLWCAEDFPVLAYFKDLGQNTHTHRFNQLLTF